MSLLTYLQPSLRLSCDTKPIKHNNQWLDIWMKHCNIATPYFIRLLNTIHLKCMYNYSKGYRAERCWEKALLENLLVMSQNLEFFIIPDIVVDFRDRAQCYTILAQINVLSLTLFLRFIFETYWHKTVSSMPVCNTICLHFLALKRRFPQNECFWRFLRTS